MSSKAVIFWLLLAIALGVTAVVLLRHPATGANGTLGRSSVPDKPTRVTAGQKLLDFVPSQATGVTIVRPDGQREFIEKAPSGRSVLGSDAEWQLRLEGEPAERAWPLAGPQVQGMLRILAALPAVADPGSASDLGTGVTEVIVSTGDAEHRLRMAERSLAGATVAEVVSRLPGSPAGATPRTVRALIDAKVHDLFTNPGPRAWREQMVLAGLAGDASRVRLENAEQTIVLGKLDGRWSVREPVTAPAEPGTVGKLIGNLGRLRIVDFLDAGPPATGTGLDAPVARLVVEVDRRTIPDGSTEPVVTTTSCDIAIGAASDAGHSRLFARIADKRVVLVEARGLSEISMAAHTYIWPHPSRQNPADVGTIVLDPAGAKAAGAGRAFKRSLSRWSQIKPDGTEVALVDKELRDVESLLTFLTGGEKGAFTSGPATPATDPNPPKISIDAPSGLQVVGKVSLLSLAGEEIESIELGITRPDAVVFRSGAVYREFSAARVPALLMEVVQSGVPTAATPPPPRVAMPPSAGVPANEPSK